MLKNLGESQYKFVCAPMSEYSASLNNAGTINKKVKIIDFN